MEARKPVVYCSITALAILGALIFFGAPVSSSSGCGPGAMCFDPCAHVKEISGQATPEAVNELLLSKRRESVNAAISCLHLGVMPNKRTNEILVELLDASDANIRFDAANFLIMMGAESLPPGTQEKTKATLEKLVTNGGQTAAEAIQTLQIYSNPKRKVHEIVFALCDKMGPIEKLQAEHELGYELNHIDALEEALELLKSFNSPNPNIRELMAGSTRHWDEISWKSYFGVWKTRFKQESPLIQNIAERLTDENADVREAAAYSLLSAGDFATPVADSLKAGPCNDNGTIAAAALSRSFENSDRGISSLIDAISPSSTCPGSRGQDDDSKYATRLKIALAGLDQAGFNKSSKGFSWGLMSASEERREISKNEFKKIYFGRRRPSDQEWNKILEAVDRLGKEQTVSR